MTTAGSFFMCVESVRVRHPGNVSHRAIQTNQKIPRHDCSSRTTPSFLPSAEEKKRKASGRQKSLRFASSPRMAIGCSAASTPFQAAAALLGQSAACVAFTSNCHLPIITVFPSPYPRYSLSPHHQFALESN